MSDLVIAQKQDLINIADAIREKAGTTDGMGIDEMAALIAAIEAGGGGVRIAYEVVTFAEDAFTYVMEHNFGAIPHFGFFVNDFATKKTYTHFAASAFYNTPIVAYSNNQYGNSTSTITGDIYVTNSGIAVSTDLSAKKLGTSQAGIGYGTESTLSFGATANYKFNTGDVVFFLAGVIDE